MRKNIQKLVIMTLIMLFALSPCAAATGDDVTNAIVTPTTLDLVNSNTTTGGDGQFVVSDTPAQGFPTEGTYYANINTGDASGEDAANFTLNLTIPEGAQTLSFDWMFASNEYPTENYLRYNDTAIVQIISGSSSQNILFLPGGLPVSVANAWSIFTAPTDNIGYTGATPIYTTSFDVSAFAGSTILLSFFIEDVGDTGVTSALFFDNLHIGPVSDLSLTKVVNDTAPVVGDTLEYLLTVNNLGPDAATGVTVTEPLSSGLQFISAVASQGTYDPDTGIWDIGTLANGESATLTINALVETAGEITNEASVQALAYDPNLSNNRATQTVEAQAEPEPVEAATVAMQKTGVPLAFMVLAVLLMLGGLVWPKRK